MLLVPEEPEGVHKRKYLAYHRSERRSLDPHSQAEDEDGVKYRIGNHREEGEPHCRLWMTRRAYYAVESVQQVREGVAEDDDGHVVPGKRYGPLARTEEIQDGIQEGQRHNGEHDADYDVKRERVGQHLAGGFIVLLPQHDGNQRHCAHAHKGAEGDADVHQREGYGEARDGVRTHVGYVPDVDAVHHIVQRSRRLGDDARDGEFPQQSAYFFRAEFKRRRTCVCHR